MPALTDVSRHYTHGSLTDAIRDGLASLGKAPGTVTVTVETDFWLGQVEPRKTLNGHGTSSPLRSRKRYGCSQRSN